MHEKDALYHEALDELEKVGNGRTTIDDLHSTLKHIDKTLQEKPHGMELRDDHNKPTEHKKALTDLRRTLQNIEKTLTESRAYAVAWETAEVELYNEKTEHEKERESIRGLLWQAAKLSGRRLKNGLRRVFDTFGWKKK
jgi:hypothetical protein